MTTVEPAWIGFIGALVGAGAALGGKWVDAYFARKGERHRHADDLLARFWEVADRMWRLSADAEDYAQLDATYPVGEHPDPTQPSASEDVHADWRRRVVEARQGVEDANIEAGVLLARMRLMNLPVAKQAEALRAASAPHDYYSAEATTTHRQALAEFEKAALRKPRPRFLGTKRPN